MNAEKRGKKKCSKCGEFGHNKTTCKGAPVNDANGRRGITFYRLSYVNFLIFAKLMYVVHSSEA